MTEANAAAPGETRPARASVARMYAAVMGVGIACALAIVAVYETTRPIIQRKNIEFRNQAILDVLPGASTTAAFRLTESSGFERTSLDKTGPDLVFAGYDANENLVGLAIEAQGMGYQDVVRVLYGYSFETQSIVGMRVLQTRETPGLGDRIGTDADFLLNFENLDVRLQPDGDELAHPIEFVKPGEKRSDWQIDGITGATITSRATAKMLRDSSAKWIPRVYPQRAEFEFAIRKDQSNEAY